MPKRTEEKMRFGILGWRFVEGAFSGGEFSSEGGMMLVRRVDERIGLRRAAVKVLNDGRAPGRIRYMLRDSLAGKIFGSTNAMDCVLPI